MGWPRFSQLGVAMESTDDGGVVLVGYTAGTVRATLADGYRSDGLTVEDESVLVITIGGDYPFDDGPVPITIENPRPNHTTTVWLRIPGWAYGATARLSTLVTDDGANPSGGGSGSASAGASASSKRVRDSGHERGAPRAISRRGAGPTSATAVPLDNGTMRALDNGTMWALDNGTMRALDNGAVWALDNGTMWAVPCGPGTTRLSLMLPKTIRM